MIRRHKNRQGFFLVLVLVVIVLSTMAVYSFTDLMVAYDESAYIRADLMQARMSVESGAEVVRLLLADPPELRLESGGTYNNPNLFQAMTVSTGLDGTTNFNYSIPAPALTETGTLGGIRFGLQNESARLNINVLPIIEQNSESLTSILALAASAEDAASEEPVENLAVSLLMALPGMTEDVAVAILDWLDEDDEPRDPNGAESEYYTTLETPYEPTNGPLVSVEELLLVRGVTPTLLFGADANRNGLLDPDEQQRYSVTTETPGALGWAQYITIHSSETSKTASGELRININKDDLETLYEELVDALGDETIASYIVAYRIGGQAPASALSAVNPTNNNNNQAQSGGVWTADQFGQLDLSGGGGTQFTQVLDLVGSTVTIGNGDRARSYESPLAQDPISMVEYLPIIMDWLTTSDSDRMPGRININECPAELLYGIPLFTEEQVQTILETREVDSEDLNRRHETWLMTEGIVTIDEMRTLTPLITCRGSIFRAQIVGYRERNGLSHRSEVIFDATTVNPKIVSWRDLNHLGRGFDLAVLGVRETLDLPADDAATAQ